MKQPWLPTVPNGAYWLRRARVPAAMLTSPLAVSADADGNVAVDLRIDDGRIAAIEPAGTAPDGIDLDGGQAWPGPVDAHVHLDKTMIWPRAANPDGTHTGARLSVTADRAHWNEADIRARFEFGLECAYAHGTVAMRTHIDSYWPHARVGWRVFRELREEWAGRIALQGVSLCPLDRFDGPDGVALADEVAASGGVLGMVTAGLGAPDPPTPTYLAQQIEHFFDLAVARGLALDLHLDETGEPAAATLRLVAETALRRHFRQPIQCGHCCSLAVQSDKEVRETIALVVDAGFSVVSLPMCNLYLQGRNPRVTPTWRGITLVHELAGAGVPVSFASDNCRDPFYAYGDYDMVEVFREAVRIAQLDHPFGSWAGAFSAIPARALGVPERGTIAVGAAADLILFRARGMTELLARPQSDRVVLRHGRILDAELPDYRRLDPIIGTG